MDESEHQKNPVPLGTSVDDRPQKRQSKPATNDADDRRKALILIGILLGVVLLVIILGNTVLRPAIINQRERIVIRVTQDQVEEFADLGLKHFQSEGIPPSGFGDLSALERLETSKGVDLWGNSFVFATVESDSGDRVLVVRSAGPDGEFETDDDIAAERVLVPGTED